MSTHSRVDQEDLSVRPFCVGSHAFQIEIWINVVVDEDLPFGPDFLGKIGCSGLFVNRINYERQRLKACFPAHDVVRIDLGAIDREARAVVRSEEHTSELQSLMRNSYAVFCLKKKKKDSNINE